MGYQVKPQSRGRAKVHCSLITYHDLVSKHMHAGPHKRELGIETKHSFHASVHVPFKATGYCDHASQPT
jgi:hypothetical protein